MRVCQFAFIGSDNLGDEAIFETIYRDLQRLSPTSHAVLSMNPARTRLIASAPGTRVLSARSSRQTLEAIRSSDVFVCGGGGLFQDQTSLYNPGRYLSRIALAEALGKLVYVYGVSVGPLSNPLNRKLTREVLGRAAGVTVRDSASRRTLIELGVAAERVHTTSDPVLNFKPEFTAPPAELRRRKVVVCLRHWFDTIDWLPVSVVNALHVRSAENTQRYEHFVGAMAEILDELAAAPDAELTFLPFWGERDTRVHREVIAKMKHRARCHVIAETPSAAHASALIASADFLFGMRLHSLIMAIANCRPFFAIDYSNKVGDFLEEVLPGRVKDVSASPVALEPRAVIARLAALDGNNPFNADYASSVARLKELELQNLELLRQALRGPRQSPDA